MFYPSPFEDYRFTWPGPDPLSADTCAEDLFLYTSAFLNCTEVLWIDFRLCEINRETQELKSQYWFFLPRIPSMMGNLPRVRGQILGILSRRAHAGSDIHSRFRLFICPWQGMGPEFSTEGPISPCSVGPPAALTLDPGFFVQNIAEGFRKQSY